MPKYNYVPEDDESDESDPRERIIRSRRALWRPTTEPPKTEYPYIVQRALVEPHRRVVAAAIDAALTDNPVRGFKPSLGEIPITLLTAQASVLIFTKTTGGFNATSNRHIRNFNDRITDFVGRANQVRPTVSAEAGKASPLRLRNLRNKRLNYVGAVRLAGEGAQTITEEAGELGKELRDPKASAFAPAFELGFSTSDEVTDSFARAMNQANLAQKITAALRSDANPEGLLEFGPLETRLP